MTDIFFELEKKLNSDYKERFKYTRYLADSYKSLHNKNCSVSNIDFLKRSENLKNCSHFLDFVDCNNELKLIRANFCKDRLCACCNYRRSKKIFYQVYTCVDYLKENYKFLFLTLTVPSVHSDMLSSTIFLLSRSFTKMLKRKKIKQNFLGTFRFLEVTYNRRKDTYHAHLHVLVAVNNNYFDKKNNYYINRDYILKCWKECTNIDTITQVDIRKIYYNKNKSNCNKLASACAEVAKYAVKSSDFIFFDNQFLTDKVVFTLSNALYNKRQYSASGVFKDTLKLLNLFNDDLINISDTHCKRTSNLLYRYVYSYSVNKYILYNVCNIYDSSDISYNVDSDTAEIFL